MAIRTYRVFEVSTSDELGVAMDLVYEARSKYGSSDALDKAEQMSLTKTGTFLVQNDQGRALASFTDGEMEYLGY